jgi:energy-converting hydrogenase Eha subunit H
MRSKRLSLRAMISALVAVVFAIAAEPGVMAMPATQPLHHAATMSCADEGMPGCDHMKLPKEKDAPCKNMAFCAGMMSCFGMAAIAVENPQPRIPSKQTAVHFHPQTTVGLTLQPDNPPPIA